jgi:uncharacterized protein (DUF488 family)
MPLPLWSVGHSNIGVERFIDLLKKNGIDVLVDVRSAPFSRYSTHFNKAPLERAVREAGISYLFMGKELGGRPQTDDGYDEEGHARYDLMAEASAFREGMDRLRDGIEQYRVAIMCSEENPEHCHRRLLVGKVLTADGGYELHHIRGDGDVEIEARVELDGLQLSLLGERPAWRSTQSVSHRSRHADSSSS